MSLNEFHALNIQRQHEAFAPPHPLTALVVCVQEEVGELAAAILGVTGEKKRKAHLTNTDVLDAVADAMTYLSLVAGSVGCTDLEKLLGDTFNMVSERAGSRFRTTLGQTPDHDPLCTCSERGERDAARWADDTRRKACEALIIERDAMRAKVDDLAGWCRYALDNWAPGGSGKADNMEESLVGTIGEKP